MDLLLAYCALEPPIIQHKGFTEYQFPQPFYL